MSAKAEQQTAAEKRWKRYENTWTQSVWCGMLLRMGLCAKWYALRAVYAYPLQRTLLRLGPGKSFTMSVGEFLGFLCSIGLIVGCVLSSGGTLTASAPLGFTFAIVNRNSIWAFLFGLPFERAIPYHKVAACVAVITGVIHGVYYGWDTSGLILVGCMVALVLTSQQFFRRRFFDAFLTLHLILLLGVIVAGVAHGVGTVLFVALLLAFDWFWRYVVMAFFKLPRKINASLLPGGIICLSFPQDKEKPFAYSGGQYLFVYLQELGWEFHPFSLSSAPHEDIVSMHIRALGNWTTKLHDLLATRLAEAGTSSVELNCIMEGPYGSPMIDLDSARYQSAILISGGIGITPMQSICNDIIEQQSRGRPFKSMWFIWTAQDKSFVDAMYPSKVAVSTGKDEESPEATEPDLPPSFTPNLVRRAKSVEGFSVNYAFHLTKTKTLPEDLSEEVKDVVKIGRPDLNETFATAHAKAKADGLKRVAVLCCGPAGLMNASHSLAQQWSKEGVSFHYHHETFEF